MPGKRNDSQTVDAFSAPKELLRAAQLEAQRRGMSKSGFYRYCLARAIGWPEEEALKVSRHLGVGQFAVIEASEQPAKKA